MEVGEGDTSGWILQIKPTGLADGLAMGGRRDIKHNSVPGPSGQVGGGTGS